MCERGLTPASPDDGEGAGGGHHVVQLLQVPSRLHQTHQHRHSGDQEHSS